VSSVFLAATASFEPGALANYAKAADYTNAAASVRGLPWWTPNYLQGCSLAFASSEHFTNLALVTGALVAGPYSGVKLAALAFLFLCPLTMFAFVRRLCPGSNWTAFSCGAAYLFAPAILLRLGHVEHVANVLAFAMIPVSFRSILVFLEQRNAWSAILCATANSLLVLAYAKIAVLILPLLAAFALWVWIARAHFTPPSGRNVFLCLAIFLILGGSPNFPSLRETRLIAKFDFGPFAGWQKSYSAESVLSWMDRESRLTGARVSAQSEVRTNASYLESPALHAQADCFFADGGMADFGGGGVPAFHGAHISRALARSRCQHGFVRSVRFSFPCGFRVGSGDSDFLGLLVLQEWQSGSSSRVSPAALAGALAILVFLRSGFPIDRTAAALW
jgi:hypothetical protein